MACIAPHFRKKSTDSVQPEAPLGALVDPYDRNLTLDEIKNHFWPAENEDEDNGNYTSDGGKGRTLHDSAQAAGELAFVILLETGAPIHGEAPRTSSSRNPLLNFCRMNSQNGLRMMQ
jgi:hypothetical protein